MLEVGGTEKVAALLAELSREGDTAEAAADVLLGHAQGLLDRGEADLALDIFDRITARFTPQDRWGQAAMNGRAGALIQIGRFVEALEVLRTLRIGSDPTDRVRLDAQIAGILLRSGRIEEAEMAFRTILETTGEKGRGSMEATLGLGQIAESRGQIETAIRLYGAVVESDEDVGLRATALQALAGLFLEAERDEEAMETYNRFKDLLPLGSAGGTNARLAMAEIHARRGDTAHEVTLLQEVLAQDMNPRSQVRAKIRLAEIDLRQGHPEEALAAYESLEDSEGLTEEFTGDVIYGRCSAYLQLGRYDDVLALLDTVQDDQPALSDLARQARLALGQVEDDAPAPAADTRPISQALEAREQGRTDEAISILRGVLSNLEDRPAQADILREIALAQAASGARDSARETLARILDQYEDLPEAAFMAGYTLAEMDLAENDPDSALQRLDDLQAPDDGHELWRIQAQASALAAKGDTEGARVALRGILEGWPGDPVATASAWTALGELTLQMGDTEKAIAAFRRAATVAPDGPLRNQARLRVASAAMERGELEEAMASVDLILDEKLDDETHWQVLLTQSAILQEKGEWKKALRTVESVPLSEPGVGYAAQFADARGVCLLALGRPADAEAVYRTLVSSYPQSVDAQVTAALGLAETAAATGDLETAERRYRELVRDTPDRFRQAQALLRLAQMLEINGRIDAARDTYHQLVIGYSDEPEIAQAAEAALE